MSLLILEQYNTNQSFNISRGDQIIIKLDESPTTGYLWTTDTVNKDILLFQGKDFSITNSRGIGGGGICSFTFLAENLGSAKITLKLWRNWEGDSSIIKRFEVKINVN